MEGRLDLLEVAFGDLDFIILRSLELYLRSSSLLGDLRRDH